MLVLFQVNKESVSPNPIEQMMTGKITSANLQLLMLAAVLSKYKTMFCKVNLQAGHIRKIYHMV